MRTETVTITPDIAEAMLKSNTCNYRKPRLVIAKQYAEDMKHGKWKLNGEAIVFHKDGTLADGQHRLIACTIAKVPFQTLVIYDVDDDVIEYDIGKPRHEMDMYKASGLIDASTTVAGIVTFLLNRQQASTYVPTSRPEKIEFAQNHLEELKKAERLICNGKEKPICKLSGLGAVAFILLHRGEDENTIARFFNVANSGFSSSEQESAAIAFRNYLLTNQMLRLQRRHGQMFFCDNAFLLYENFKRGERRVRPYKPNGIFAAILNDYLDEIGFQVEEKEAEAT